MQTTNDHADFPSGTAVSGSSTADSSGINGSFTEYDVLMRERDALVCHRQMLKRKKTELEQSLQKQRSEREVCPALFVFPSAEALLRATQSDRVQSTFITHGIAHQCVHNSTVLSSWSTPIGSGVGATGLTEYQKSFHAHYLTRTLRHAERFYLCATKQVAVMRALTTVHSAPMLRRLALKVPELTEAMARYISQWEAEGQLEYVSIRLYRVTTSPLLCSLLRLKEVNLSFTLITDKGVRLLSECHTLVKINLSYCTLLTNVNPLSSIATLEVIDLSGCTSLTHVGALGRLPVLKEVNLNSTRITDEEVRLLSECHTLVKIFPISCEVFTNVNSLSSIATLEVIKLSWCTSLTHVGELGKLPALKEVNLRETRITDEEIRLLSESNTLVKIDLSCCKALTNVNPLSSIATLEVIKLSWCTSLTYVGALGRLPVLKEVYLNNTRITDKGVRLLSECHTLVKINLSYCTLLTNVNPLSSIATLEVIDLSGCTSLTHVGELGKLPVLKEVNLGKARITNEEVRLLSESHTLVKIYLGSCKALTNVNPLASIETLEVIYLTDCTRLIHVGALGRLPALREIFVGGTPITEYYTFSLGDLRQDLGLPPVFVIRDM